MKREDYSADCTVHRLHYTKRSAAKPLQVSGRLSPATNPEYTWWHKNHEIKLHRADPQFVCSTSRQAGKDNNTNA